MLESAPGVEGGWQRTSLGTSTTTRQDKNARICLCTCAILAVLLIKINQLPAEADRHTDSTYVCVIY